MSDAIFLPTQLRPTADFEQVYDILGTTVTILPLYGQDGSAAGKSLITDTGFTTVRATSSGLEAVFLWSPDVLSTFATPSKSVVQWRGDIPIVTFDGSTEFASGVDNAYWTRAGAAWSFAIWVRPAVVDAAMSFFAKWETTQGREWDVGMNVSGQPYIHVGDESVFAQIGRYDATSLTANTWQHLVFVDDGSNASTGLDVYLNGAAVDDTDDNSGVFVAMEDGTAVPRLGIRGPLAGLSQAFSGEMAGGGLGPCFVQAAVTAAQVKRLYQWGTMRLKLL